MLYKLWSNVEIFAGLLCARLDLIMYEGRGQKYKRILGLAHGPIEIRVRYKLINCNCLPDFKPSYAKSSAFNNETSTVASTDSGIGSLENRKQEGRKAVTIQKLKPNPNFDGAMC